MKINHTIVRTQPYLSGEKMAIKNQKGYRKKRRLHSLIISLVIHCVAVAVLGIWLLKPIVQNSEDRMYVELMDAVSDQRQMRKHVPKPRLKLLTNEERTITTTGIKRVSSSERVSTPVNPVAPVQEEIPLDAPSMIQNVTRLAPSPESILDNSKLDGPNLNRGDGPIESVSPVRSKGNSGSVGVATREKGSSGIGNLTKGTGSEYADLGGGYGRLSALRDKIGDKLGGIIIGTGSDLQAHIRVIRLKHSLSDWWQDPTAIPSLIEWLEFNTPLRADMSFAGGALRMTDTEIMNAPLIIMTGHEKEMTQSYDLMRGEKRKSGFSDEERAALRRYVLKRGGTLFFDDCGLKGGFSELIERELNQIFPEYRLERLPHEHELYNIYYQLSKPPEGGEVFWESENKARPTKYKFHRGIYVPRPGASKSTNLTYKDTKGVLRTTNRLGVIFNRKDYLCAMETAEIESRTALRNRRSTDVYRFMTNLMVYTLKYGGNTDRSEYKEK